MIAKRMRMAVAVALMLAAVSGSAFASPVPEIDPGSMSAAVTLLSCAALVLTNRRAR